MPIYEYRCGACQKRVEVFQRERRGGSQQRSPACPLCQGTSLQPVFSRFAVSVEESWAGFDGTNDLDSDDPEALKSWADGLAEQTGMPYPEGFTDALAGNLDDDALADDS